MADPQPPIDKDEPNGEAHKAPTLLQVALSVLAAAFGVQSNRNRQRDFTKGKPLQYILVGLIFTTLFVLTLIAAVHLIL